MSYVDCLVGGQHSGQHCVVAALHRRPHYASPDFNPVEDALLRKTASLTFPAMLMDSPEWQDQRDARLDAWTEERDGYDFS